MCMTILQEVPSAQRRVQPRPKGFRPDIEGLRAVAVLAVVLYHAQIPGITGGYVGVDVLFVISGFLITGLLWRETGATNTVALGHFYAARARRLLPAAAAVGAVTAIVAAVVLPPLQARSVFMDGIASALYVGNYRFATQGTDYLASGTPSPFQHYWSLGTEEQFYLAWPVLIIGTAWLLGRIGRGDAVSRAAPYAVVLAALGAASPAAAVQCTRTSPPWAFFSLPTRAWELAAGGLVALSIRRWRRLPLLPAAIAGPGDAEVPRPSRRCARRWRRPRAWAQSRRTWIRRSQRRRPTSRPSSSMAAWGRGVRPARTSARRATPGRRRRWRWARSPITNWPTNNSK